MFTLLQHAYNEFRDLDSLHTWKTFAQAYIKEPDAEALQSRTQIVPRLDMYLDDYIEHITSPAFAWITFLSLSDITCSRVDVINIARLVNLGTLTIGPGIQLPDVGIDDHIIRSWSRSALESGAFSRLRVFACRNQVQLTERSFHCIRGLPALNAVVLEACSLGSSNRHSAKKFGWDYRGSKALALLLSDGGCTDKSWESIVKTLHDKADGSHQNYSRLEDDQTTAQTPILSFSIGGAPKPASFDKAGKNHICYFEKMHEIPTASIDDKQASLIAGTSEDVRQARKRAVLRQDKEPVKKRTIKSSKQRQIESAFTEFGL